MFSDQCTWPWGPCLLFELGQAPTPRLAVIMVKREPTPLKIGEACIKRILSSRPVSREWDNITQVVQWTRIMALLVQPAREGFCVLRTNRTREAERDFGGLPIRRDEGRVVDPPQRCLKRVFFSGDVKRALDGENLRRALRKETWSEIGVKRKERR
ncbi:hypothetical protein TNCV_3083241 [Trichonephila clavipes]|nr:hypothetical protein TNCV_3083241 [Trichonephila clavipes]